MDESRKEVLEAEAAIRELATELARAKGITESVETVERCLHEATIGFEHGRRALDEAQGLVKQAVERSLTALASAERSIQRSGEMLDRNARGLSATVGQAIKDLSEQLQSALLHTHQALQEQITSAIGEAQKGLLGATNRLSELRSGLDEHVTALAQKNEQMGRRVEEMDAQIRRLAKSAKLCLGLVCLVAITSVFAVVLILQRM